MYNYDETDYDIGFAEGRSSMRDELEEKAREGNKKLPRMPKLLGVDLARTDSVKFIDGDGKELVIAQLSSVLDKSTGKWNTTVVFVRMDA